MGFPSNLTFVHKQNSCKKQRKKKRALSDWSSLYQIIKSGYCI